MATPPHLATLALRVGGITLLAGSDGNKTILWNNTGTAKWEINPGVSTSNIAATGTLNVSGNTTVSSITTDDAHITGNETVDGTLSISGSTTVSDIHSTGNEIIDGTLSVTGNTTVSNISASGNETIGGTLSVTGDAIFNKNITVLGNTNSTGDLSSQGKILTLNNIASPTDANADGGGIILKGDTDKNILWNNSSKRWNITDGISTGTGRFTSQLSSTVATGTAPFIVNSTTEVANLHSATATKLHTARTIALGGDLSGSVSFNGTKNVTINSTINANSVALGNDTTGNYVATVAAGGGIDVAGSGSENAGVTVSHSNTSSQASVNNSNGNVIQDVNVDTYGHITGLTSYNLDDRYYTETESNSRFTYRNNFDWRGTGALTSTTTSDLKSELLSKNVFNSNISAFKTSWNYDNNGNLTDAGRLTELAGTSWLTWTDNSADNVQGNITSLVIAPNTGDSANKVFIYNDQGSNYNPGWREIWTSESDGSGSGLDADKLDGYHASTSRDSASTIPIRDNNGHLNLGWINTTSGNTTNTVSDFFVNTNDGYIRKATVSHARNQLGTMNDSAKLGGQLPAYYTNASNISTGTISDARLPDTISSNITGNAATASNADKLDSLNSTSFLRSDADDIINCNLSFADGKKLTLDYGTNGGLKFKDNAFGGTGDTASIKLLNPTGGENTEFTITMTNDATDIINLVTPSSTGLKHNRNTVWTSANDGSDSGLDADKLDGLQATNFVRQVNANGYDGLAIHDGTTSNWIRTTNNGLIPYASGGASALGTSSWPFNKIYGNDIYDGGTLLEDKYLGKTAKAADADKLDGHDSSYFQAAGSYVTTNGVQALDASDALSINDHTITLKKGDGSTETVTVPDNNDNTTYTADKGVMLTGTTFSIKGNEIPDKADLNTYRSTGIYTQDANADASNGSHYPVAKAGILQVLNDDYGNGLFTTQLYSEYDTTNYYTRTYYNGNWTSWRNLSQDTNTWRSITDSTSTSSSSVSASATAVKSAYDLANTKLNSSSYTANDVLAKIKSVDGSGSGLDADKLDGLDSTQFLRKDTDNSFPHNLSMNSGKSITFNSLNNSGSDYGRIQYDADNNTYALWGDSNENSALRIIVENDGTNADSDVIALEAPAGIFLNSPNIYQGTGNKIWHSGNDGSGSGLDADLLDGHDSSYYINAAGSDNIIDKSADYTATNKDFIYADTSSASFTITLPSSPGTNDRVSVVDAKSSFDKNSLVIARNGNTIMGLAEDMTVSTKNISLELMYHNNDWRLV